MRLSQMSPAMPAFSIKPLNQVTLMTWKARVDTQLLEQRIIQDIIKNNEQPLLFAGHSVAPLAAEVMQRVQQLSNQLVRIYLSPGLEPIVGVYTVGELWNLPFIEMNWKQFELRILTNLMVHRAVVMTQGGWFPGAQWNISTVGIAGFITQELNVPVSM